MYWDVPPPGFEHITPMQYKAMQGNLDFLFISIYLATDAQKLVSLCWAMYKHNMGQCGEHKFTNTNRTFLRNI